MKRTTTGAVAVVFVFMGLFIAEGVFSGWTEAVISLGLALALAGLLLLWVIVSADFVNDRSDK